MLLQIPKNSICLHIHSGSEVHLYSVKQGEEEDSLILGTGPGLTGIVTFENKLKFDNNKFAVIDDKGVLGGNYLIRQGPAEEASTGFTIVNGHLLFNEDEAFYAINVKDEYHVTPKLPRNRDNIVIALSTRDNNGEIVQDYPPKVPQKRDDVKEATTEATEIKGSDEFCLMSIHSGSNVQYNSLHEGKTDKSLVLNTGSDCLSSYITSAGKLRFRNNKYAVVNDNGLIGGDILLIQGTEEEATTGFAVSQGKLTLNNRDVFFAVMIDDEYNITPNFIWGKECIEIRLAAMNEEGRPIEDYPKKNIVYQKKANQVKTSESKTTAFSSQTEDSAGKLTFSGASIIVIMLTMLL